MKIPKIIFKHPLISIDDLGSVRIHAGASDDRLLAIEDAQRIYEALDTFWGDTDAKT